MSTTDISEHMPASRRMRRPSREPNPGENPYFDPRLNPPIKGIKGIEKPKSTHLADWAKTVKETPANPEYLAGPSSKVGAHGKRAPRR